MFLWGYFTVAKTNPLTSSETGKNYPLSCMTKNTWRGNFTPCASVYKQDWQTRLWQYYECEIIQVNSATSISLRIRGKLNQQRRYFERCAINNSKINNIISLATPTELEHCQLAIIWSMYSTRLAFMWTKPQRCWLQKWLKPALFLNEVALTRQSWQNMGIGNRLKEILTAKNINKLSLWIVETTNFLIQVFQRYVLKQRRGCRRFPLERAQKKQIITKTS